MEILKVYRQVDKQQPNGKAHFSAGELNLLTESVIRYLLANLCKHLQNIGYGLGKWPVGQFFDIQEKICNYGICYFNS